MAIYKQSENVRRTTCVRWHATWRVYSELRRHCLLLRCQGLYTAFCSCQGVFSICWCFDCNMHAICYSNDIGKTIFCSSGLLKTASWLA